jgi:hypothetical protein
MSAGASDPCMSYPAVPHAGRCRRTPPQVWWTWETEDVFRRVREGDKHAMKNFAAKLTGQLGDLTAMVSEVGLPRFGCQVAAPQRPFPGNPLAASSCRCF